ncbi:hypothetical protein ABIA16_005389 [Sinorhizobium fredii]
MSASFAKPEASPVGVAGKESGRTMAVGKARSRRMAAWSAALPKSAPIDGIIQPSAGAISSSMSSSRPKSMTPKL